MKLLYGHSEEVALWVGMRIPYVAKRLARDPLQAPFGASVATGVITEAGEMIGGVVYHSYDPDCPSIEMSFACSTPRWLTRALICELLRYPMQDLSCRRITAVTPRRATSARQFLEKFGFRREGVATEAFGDDDAIISRLLKREWLATKWAQPRPIRRTPKEAAHVEKGPEFTAAA